jgi:general secretion pathway protein J
MRQPGFTLIEVVVAIFIAAVMFAIGYSALNQAVIDRDALATAQDRVTEIQRGMRVVAQDFAQLAARAARDTQGNGDLQPAISGGAATGTDVALVTFTRTGWSNPAGIQRPAEQRVRYRFVDGSLLREYWLSVDPALNSLPRQRVVLTQIKSVEVRYLDPATRTWRKDWPARQLGAPVGPLNLDEALLTRPLAIEFTLVLEDWGRVQRVFEVPT